MTAPRNINAVDDGHDQIKTCKGFDGRTGKFDCSSIKSIAMNGMQQIISHGVTSSAYVTNDQIFTVAGENAFGKHLDTRHIGYPTSALNRVLVQHALIEMGLSGHEVAIVTGLPVDQYYQNGVVNSELIENKTKSLLIPVANINTSIAPVAIRHNQVVSEGIAALYDVWLNGDGTVNEDIAELVRRRPITVVDLGGKTLDIPTIAEGGAGIYAARSGTYDIGVIRLKEKIASLIKAKYRLSNDPPALYVDEALRTKTYELFGKNVDVSEILVECCREYVGEVQNSFQRMVGDGSDLGAVIFVGGGAALIQSVLGYCVFNEIFQGRVILPEEPQFANVRGMWKAANYVFEPPEWESKQMAGAKRTSRTSALV